MIIGAYRLHGPTSSGCQRICRDDGDAPKSPFSSVGSTDAIGKQLLKIKMQFAFW
jgi:hypothetical protein